MKIIHLYLTALYLGTAAITSLLLSPQANALEGSEYYKQGYDPMFKPHPTDTGRKPNQPWRIRYLGPVGIGIDLKRPGMTMEIWNVEEGSPADKTGKLKKGQIIESINGVILKDTDPRIILGDIITEAEAKDGVIDLKIKDEGTVRVQIPVMGVYSDTWPLNCPKSDKIVRNLADLLAKEETPSWGSVLFLLSTGEEKDLDVVRKWMQNIEQVGGMTWETGYKGFGVCEYYLRTGDDSVLPAIEKSLDDLKGRMYQGAWSGRDMPAKFTYGPGSGMLHASGMYAMNFILMAKLCGVEVDEKMFQESFRQFYRYAGHGLVPYGHSRPEAGFRDNGKHSGLALALATATMVSPKGESSVYAGARDLAAMKAFYATNWFHAAHTGGGMGEIWHHAAVALMREKRPAQYRDYLDTRRWVMDLSRRHDHSIAIEGMDDQYNRSVTDASGQRAWGTYFALTYTYPRKTLQLWGAPRSSHAHQSELPERPWGNATDDIFQSPEPIHADGSLPRSITLHDDDPNLLKFCSISIPAVGNLSSIHPSNRTGLMDGAPVVEGGAQIYAVAEAYDDTSQGKPRGVLTTLQGKPRAAGEGSQNLKEKMEAILNGTAEKEDPAPVPVEAEGEEESDVANLAPPVESAAEPTPEPVVATATPPASRTHRQPLNNRSSSGRSFEPLKIGGKLTMEDLLNETVEKDASHPSLTRLSQIESEQEVYKWLLHPESGFRVGAIKQIVEQEWDHMVVPLMKAEDSRLRHVGLLAITGMFKGAALPDERVTPEMWDQVDQILEDPDEAWWTLFHAVLAMKRADPERIASHRERLLELLEHESVWIRHETVMTLVKIATDPDHYKVVLKPIMDTSSSFMLDGASWFTTDAIKRAIKGADAEVKDYVEPLAHEAFLTVPFPLEDPYTGARPGEGGIILRSRYATILRELPGGEAFLRQLPLTTLKSHASGNSADRYQFNGTHEPNEKAPGKWAVAWPRPESPDEFDKAMKERLATESKPPALGRYYLTVEEGGGVSGRMFWGSIWTGNWLLNLYEQKAQRMEFKTHEGIDFMFIETEDFEKVSNSDGWHEYYMFIRAEGPGSPWNKSGE